jgi:DNA-binding MurR/RpiR family transcriptional regulator
MDDAPDQTLTQSTPDQTYSSDWHATALQIIQIKQAKPDISGNDLAALVGVHPSTVSRWLKLLQSDTVPEARKLLKSQALRASMKIVDQVDHSDPRVSQQAAKTVLANAGVVENSQAIQVGVQVIVGTPQAPAGRDPWDESPG